MILKLYNSRHFILGMLSLLLLVYVAQSIINPSKKTSNMNDYYAIFPQVSGISVGDKVLVMGVTSGVIKTIKLSKSNEVIVGFSLNSELKLPTDTPVFIETASIFGSKIFNLQPSQFIKTESIANDTKGISDEFGGSSSMATQIENGGTFYRTNQPLILSNLLDNIISLGESSKK